MKQWLDSLPEDWQRLRGELKESRTERALSLFQRALGHRANGLKFIDGMTVPTRIKPCAGTRRRRNAVKARRRSRNA